MLTVHPEFIMDEKTEKKSVILPFAEWQHLMEEMEELEDIRAYDQAKLLKEDALPFEDAVRQIKAASRK